MMLKNLKKILESRIDKEQIFDIVIFGSFLRDGNKPNDLDILVIFNNGNLEERLNKIQEMKSLLKKEIKIPIDIKQIKLKELFSPSFFARSGVLLEGYSIIKEKPFSETLGFKSYSLFDYSLKGLNHTEKIKFNYILAGRGKKGVIEELEGKRIASGAVKIPIYKANTFEMILKDNDVKYSRKDILEEE